MQETIITHGRLASPNQVELDQPIAGIQGEVDVILRARLPAAEDAGESVFEFLRRISPGNLSRDEIDAEVQTERMGWERPK
jgi:hypothetical protein